MADKHTDQAKGRVKKAAGELTGDDEMKREGQADKMSGKAKDVVDKAKRAFTDKNR